MPAFKIVEQDLQKAW